MNRFREWLSDNLRYIMLIGGILIVMFGMFFGVRAVSKVFKNGSSDTSFSQDTVVDSADAKGETGKVKVQTIEDHGKLLVNAVPDVTQLMKTYYTAKSNHDADAAAALVDVLPDNIKDEITKSVSTYTDVQVYTKNGFSADSYVVYATYKEQKEGSEVLTPGIEQAYAEKVDGKMQLIMSPMDASTTAYIEAVGEDSDVRELEDKVAKEAGSVSAAGTVSSLINSTESGTSSAPEQAAGTDSSVSGASNAAGNASGASASDSALDGADSASDNTGSADPSSDDSENAGDETAYDSEDDSSSDSSDEASYDSEDEEEDETADEASDDEELSSGDSEDDEASYDEASNDDEEDSWSGVIMNAGGVNLRPEASYDKAEIAVLDEGTEITVDYADGGWYHVTTSDGRSGFVGKKYVGTPDEYDGPQYEMEEETQEEEQDRSWTGTIYGASSVNVRSGAGFDYEVIGSIPEGESVTVQYEKAGWYYVDYYGLTGYVGHSYLK